MAQREFGFERASGDWRKVIADPEVDAIYNPLPNHLHGKWTRAALDAGKHVLCEKPFTANAEEAREIAAVAAGSDRVAMEAFHYRYHPMTERIEEIIASGELGELRQVHTALSFPLPRFSDIRYHYALAGGALMDAGCYAVHMARTFGGATPEVVSAQAKLRDPLVDRAMTAQLRFPAGHTGTIRCSLWSSNLLQISARVIGEHGELRALNPLMPQYFHRLRVSSPKGKRVERFTHRARLFPVVQSAIGWRRLHELAPRFDGKGVCWSVYRSLSQSMASERGFVRDNPIFSPMTHASGESYPTPGAAATFVDTPRRDPAPAPGLGQHTDEVLAEVLSLSAAQIGHLHDQGLVAGPGGD